MYKNILSTYKDNFFDPLYRQCFVLKGISGNVASLTMPSFFCSLHNDFTDDGIAISEYFCTGDDLRYGESPAATLRGSIVNEYGLVTETDLQLSTAYIGVETEKSTWAAAPDDRAFLSFEGDTFYARADGLYMNEELLQEGDFYGLYAEAHLSYTTAFGETGNIWLYAVSTGGAYLYVKNIGAETGQLYSANISMFMSEKLRSYGAVLFTTTFMENSAAGEVTYNDVKLYLPNGETWQFNLCPMGGYDLSTARITTDNVIRLEDTTTVMTQLDRSARQLVRYLKEYDDTFTISFLLNRLSYYSGVSVSANTYPYVEDEVEYDELSRFDDYATYRQIINWLAEYAGCSVRVDRIGHAVEFYRLGEEMVRQYDLDDISVDGFAVAAFSTGRVTGLRITDQNGKVHPFGDQTNPYSIYCNPFIPVNPRKSIYTQFLATPVYNPASCTIINAEPWLDVGDVVSIPITLTNGYVYADDVIVAYADPMQTAFREGMQYDDIPLLQREFRFNGRCHADYIANGNKLRSIDEAEDYSSYSDSLTGEDLMNGFSGYAESLDTANGNLASTGRLITEDGAEVSVPSGTAKSVANIFLTKGIWILIAYARFASNATGYRTVLVSNSENSSAARAMIMRETLRAADGANTEMRCVAFMRVTDTGATIYENVIQTSGTALTVTPRFYALQIA